MVHLVTGGSGSGKSAFAEEIICGHQREVRGSLYYIATMQPFGEETKQKIIRHRKMRENKGFQTIECYTGLQFLEKNESAVQSGWNKAADKCVLLECMSNLAANEIYQKDGAGENTVEAVMQGMRKLKDSCRHLVIVTNEVCSEGAAGSEEMRSYRQKLAEINCRLAEMADAVTEAVYGIPVRHKTPDMEGIKHAETEAVYGIPVGHKTPDMGGLNMRSTEAVYGIPVRHKSPDMGGLNMRTEEITKEMPHQEARLVKNTMPDSVKGQNVQPSMKLIIGGAYQGKLTYALEKYGERNWTDGACCAFEEVYACGGICHFESYIRRIMEAGKDTSGLAKSIAEQNPGIVIVSTEIGYGLVPVDAFEREYREQTGRVCTELAGLASNVDRVVCGIGTVLKGE